MPHSNPLRYWGEIWILYLSLFLIPRSWPFPGDHLISPRQQGMSNSVASKHLGVEFTGFPKIRRKLTVLSLTSRAEHWIPAISILWGFQATESALLGQRKDSERGLANYCRKRKEPARSPCTSFWSLGFHTWGMGTIWGCFISEKWFL